MQNLHPTNNEKTCIGTLLITIKVLKYSYYNYMNDVLVKSAFPVVSHSGLAALLRVFMFFKRAAGLARCSVVVGVIFPLDFRCKNSTFEL